MKAIHVSNLTVNIASSGAEIVSGVSFSIDAGKVLGMVGESGSGKSTIAMALLNFARDGAKIMSGEVLVDGHDILAMKGAELRAARGNLVSYVPQDPSVSLNPVLRIGAQLREALPGLPGDAVNDRIRAVLEEVELPSTKEFLRKYPHEMSGGQQQRVVIAMAVLTNPRLLVLDEPTTALDVSTQARVLNMVANLCRQHEMAAVYVSHDLGVVSTVADQILVLYSGRIVEYGERATIFGRPQHPYTVGLLGAMPSPDERRRLVGITGRAPSPTLRPSGCTFAPRCAFSTDECTVAEPPLVLTDFRHDVRCIRTSAVSSALRVLEPPAPLPNLSAPSTEKSLLEVQKLSARYGNREVLTDISIKVDRGQCLALVGESGSGKSTLSRSLVGLHHEWNGTIELDGTPLKRAAAERDAATRRRLQYVFQNPYSSLNPRRTIAESVAVPLDLFLNKRGHEARSAVEQALDRVGLPTGLGRRYPSELSGGERQRAAIARAIVSQPDVLLCDEVTSALDVSVQATVIELLRDLMSDGLTLVFVTHNLAVVRSLADRVAVLDQGRIVENGASTDIFERPTAPYTQRLLASTPGVPAAH